MLTKDLFYDLKKIKEKNSRLLDNSIFLMENNRLEELRINELFSIEKGKVDSLIVFNSKIELELEENELSDEILPIETLRELFYFLDMKHDRKEPVLNNPLIYLPQSEELKLISLKNNESNTETLVFCKEGTI